VCWILECVCKINDGGPAVSSPVEDNNGGEGSEAEHPEPEEDVDLLVEDIEWEDAKGVVLLQLTRGTELVESALR